MEKTEEEKEGKEKINTKRKKTVLLKGKNCFKKRTMLLKYYT